MPAHTDRHGIYGGPLGITIFFPQHRRRRPHSRNSDRPSAGTHTGRAKRIIRPRRMGRVKSLCSEVTVPHARDQAGARRNQQQGHQPAQSHPQERAGTERSILVTWRACAPRAEQAGTPPGQLPAAFRSRRRARRPRQNPVALGTPPRLVHRQEESAHRRPLSPLRERKSEDNPRHHPA